MENLSQAIKALNEAGFQTRDWSAVAGKERLYISHNRKDCGYIDINKSSLEAHSKFNQINSALSLAGIKIEGMR